MLLLVRHGRTVQDPSVPAEHWPLDPAGHAALERLRARPGWDVIGEWYSSPEPKALATAAALTDSPVSVSADLREVGRGPWTADYDGTVGRLVSRPDAAPAPGWEPAGAAVARFDGALRQVVARHAGTDVAVVTHGLVLTLWRARLRGAAVDLGEWRTLRFPDLLVLADEEVGDWLAGAGRRIELRTCP